MGRPLPSWALLVIVLAPCLPGCAAKPPEKPIVLRSSHPERRVVQRQRPRVPATAPPAEQAVATPGEASAAEAAQRGSGAALNADEKERLFRSFDAYLARSGQAQ